jgi:AraC-like DNA-binding protein
MQHGGDISLVLPDAILLHQNLPKRVMAEHSHDRHEVIIPLGGRIRVGPAGGRAKSVEAGRGEMILIPAQTPRSYAVTGGDAEQVIALFDPVWLTTLPPDHIMLLQHSILVAEIVLLLMTDEAAKKNAAVIETLRLAVQRSVQVARSHVPAETLRSKIHDDRLRKALVYMEAHFDDDEVLSPAAAAAAMSPRTFSRLCRQNLGLSPGDLLRSIRISQAKSMLAAGRYSVT